MALVRILEPDDFDPDGGCFNSAAFTASKSDKSISAFDLACAKAASGNPCLHIAKFYPERIRVPDAPVYYWIFDPENIPAPKPPKPPKPGAPVKTHRVVQSRSKSGDDCHHGIFNLSEGVRRRFFKAGHYDQANKRFINVFRCSGGKLEKIDTVADLPELQTKPAA